MDFLSPFAKLMQFLLNQKGIKYQQQQLVFLEKINNLHIGQLITYMLFDILYLKILQ